MSWLLLLALAGLLLVPLAGCGTASRVVRLDTGKGIAEIPHQLSVHYP